MKLTLAVILSLAFTPVAAQDFEIGKAAYYAGDYATALQEWTPLAEAGDVDAQNWLGAIYSNGDGVLQDYAEALKWYKMAAEAGDVEGQSKLGNRYRLGIGLPQDDAEAFKWYRLAAVQNDASAQYSIGYMYRNGNGVLQDNVMAHLWLNIASANGGELAGRKRDELADSMTPAAIEKAQSMARECMSSGYTECGY